MNLGKVLMLFKKHADEIVKFCYEDFFIEIFELMMYYEDEGVYSAEVDVPIAMVFRTHGVDTLTLSPEGEIDILDTNNNAYLKGYSDIMRIVKVKGEEVEIIEGDKLTELIQLCKNVPDYLLR